MGMEWDWNGTIRFDYQYFKLKCGNGMGMEWESNGNNS